MFGGRGRVEALQAQVDALTRQVEQLSGQVASVRPFMADTARLEAVADRADGFRRAAEVALAGLEQQARAVGVAHPRFEPELNTVYRAETLGFVALYFVGGFTDRTRVLVGDLDPPTQSIAEANSANDLNSYAGGIVRTGEYWMIESQRGNRSGFRCTFTPLF